MGKKPVNAVKGQQGFQKTGRNERGKNAPTSGVDSLASTTGDAAGHVEGRITGVHDRYRTLLRAQDADRADYPDTPEAAAVGDAFMHVMLSSGNEDPNWEPDEPDRETLIRYAITEQGRADWEYAISQVSGGIAIHEGHAEAEPEKAALHLRRAQATRYVVDSMKRLLTEADERVNADRAGRGLTPLPHPAGATGVRVGDGFQEPREVTINGRTATLRPRSVVSAETAAIAEGNKAAAAIESGVLDRGLVKARSDALKAFSVNPSQQTWDAACDAQERLLASVDTKGFKNKMMVTALRSAYREVMKDPFALVSGR